MAVSDGDEEAPLEAIRAVLPGRWDGAALRAGASVSLLLAVPLTIVAGVVDPDSSALRALFFFGAMLGFVIGAGCAAWVQRSGTPISHALVTASGTYLAAQAVFVSIRLLRGDEVNWFGVFFTLTLVLGAGLIGGLLGSRLQAKGFTPSSAAMRQDRAS